MNSSLEDELAVRFQERGSRADFEQLCRLLLPQVQRHLLVLTRGDLHDTEDLQQEVLIALFHSLPRFRFQSRLRTYVWRLTHHVAVGHLRRWVRRRNREDRHHRRELPLRDPEDPVAEVERKDEVDRVQAALDRLSDKDRSLLYLREMEGLSLEELAKVLGVPLGTVKSRLSRAKQALAKVLEREDSHG